MDLCKDAIDAISLLRDKRRVDDAAFAAILDSIREASTDRHAYEKQLKRGEQKLIALSLITLLVEACKTNRGLKNEVNAIKSVLDDCEADEQYSKLVLNLYETELRDKLYTRLQNMKIEGGCEQQTKNVVDVTWTQDLVIKSKLREHISEVNYLIDLHTEDGDKIGFMCTLQGLQDLTSKLKECRKSIERTYDIKT
ncbi:COMM domain-containing protein 3-like protein [Dinothrombium tinctorium]|uniref:COMM domain-containing protein 3 n=1 Tax=Dinothrombium tinctorium TaxID=1965070 RepID=A0A443QUE0_9ACAR|nr:COMM domain-containing protein 3-like protein [Dinothrombium tinctorium]